MKNLISKLVQNLGYRITKISNEKIAPKEKILVDPKTDLLINFYDNLKKAHFYPKFVVDIGANTGTWTRELLEHFPETSVVMIEPQENLKSNFQDLLNDKITYLPMGASNKNDTLLFTIFDRDDSCSFIYTKEEAEKMGLEQREIPVKTLNSIIKEHHFPCPDMIKIDAEGLDLEVIEGASDFYGKTEIFLVEASVSCDAYKNTVAEIVKLMDSCGYQTYEITDLNRPFPHNPILWLIEIAFVRKNGTLINNIKI